MVWGEHEELAFITEKAQAKTSGHLTHKCSACENGTATIAQLFFMPGSL